ncbi:hypothetical protein DP939_31730 [Spongiactinospora rosea]|uniref:Uncharacterized protein n=1 Tax=Spongiactinospora rosea TaxID=2248750 RepID=A0A366LQL4_9ACTN|nr:hypothetical protein [Spongiactinospora rosea]RBQ16186.1 hypothetical protein DP939_31730 [Spongiactinospora rosea]
MALLGRLRYASALIGVGLCVVGALVVVWYVLHLVTALALGVTLMISARRGAARDPRTPGFVALSLVLTVLVLLWG